MEDAYKEWGGTLLNDIADAMILGELLKGLFANKVIIVFTSNTEPKNLYSKGLQREKFHYAIKLIEEKGLHIAPGLFDLHVNFKDPGYEWKEDISSGIKAAYKGGFTGVVAMPSTWPDTK